MAIRRSPCAIDKFQPQATTSVLVASAVQYWLLDVNKAIFRANVQVFEIHPANFENFKGCCTNIAR